MSLFGKTEKNEKTGSAGRAVEGGRAGAREDLRGREGAPTAPDPPRSGHSDTTSAPARGRTREREGSMANIGKSITISGDLTGEEDLVIEGKVDGKVSLPNSQLTVGENGSVKAEVQAKAVVVVGRVSGNVRGTERVEIQSTGVVEGDVMSPKLVVAEGAVLNGSIQMSATPGASVGQPAPPQGEVRKAG